jgi:ligand-binding sensor domain-containing protein
MRRDVIYSKMIFRARILFVLIPCIASTSLALNPKKNIAQYGHSFWNRENGLPSNSIKVVYPTSDGYIWLGTTSGLFKFDGETFSEVSTDLKAPELPEMISALCETKDGSLWIGTQYRGLRRIKNGKLYAYGLKEGFYDTQITDLFETREGYLLIGTAIGLFKFEAGNGGNTPKFIPIIVNPNYIRDIAEDPSGRIWVGTYEGVKIIDGKKLKTERSITTADGLPNNVVTYVYVDRDGNIWIGTFGGLAKWHKGKITVYNTGNGLPNYHINAVYQDRDGNIWVGTEDGLAKMSAYNKKAAGSEDKWDVYTHLDGLTDNNVTSFAEDREGSLWVGTGDGLNQFKDVSITVYTKSEGLPNNHISSIVETPDRSLYFLSDQGSSVTQLKDNKITVFNIPVGPAFVARDGSLWIGQSGLLFKIKNGKLTRFDTHSGLPQRWISAFTEDKKSLIMYIDHLGIFRFVNGHLKPYIMPNGQIYPTPEEYVVCFYMQSDSVLWIGTSDSLMEVLPEKEIAFTTKDGLAANWISSIYDDHQGNLWIGSPQGGLTRYRNGKFTPYDSKIGLFTDEIYCVLGDDQGGLWLSSPSGIGYVSIQELNDYADGKIRSIHSRVYSTADGMKTDECFGEWQPAGWKAYDGSLWFATRRGAVKINPRSFNRNKLPPPVVIEQVLADGASVPWNRFADLLPGTKKLEIHYTALSFLNPGRVFFKYMLEGYDHEWVEAGTRRAAYYTNLPPRRYHFKVIACNNDGVWNETGASFDFYLEPHFYQTSWFQLLVGVSLGGILFGIYRLRVWQLLRREKELDQRIQEALANIKTLSGLIPICSNCKKIRGDKGYWENLEKYIQTHSEAKFSHSLCPDCFKELYPEYDKNQNDQK